MKHRHDRARRRKRNDRMNHPNQLRARARMRERKSNQIRNRSRQTEERKKETMNSQDPSSLFESLAVIPPYHPLALPSCHMFVLVANWIV